MNIYIYTYSYIQIYVYIYVYTITGIHVYIHIQTFIAHWLLSITVSVIASSFQSRMWQGVSPHSQADSGRKQPWIAHSIEREGGPQQKK